MSDHIPTLADVCNAIAEGRLAASSDGFTYHVNALELRRYFDRSRSLPAISFLHELASACSSDSQDCSLLDLCSFGL